MKKKEYKATIFFNKGFMEKNPNVLIEKFEEVQE